MDGATPGYDDMVYVCVHFMPRSLCYRRRRRRPLSTFQSTLTM